MVPCPIVVAAPRSGFSLLIQITNTLMTRHGCANSGGQRGRVLRGLLEVTSRHATRLYQQTFERFGITSDLIFNGEFHKLIGGPKWISDKRPERACFRKYFGVRGRGDFLLVTSHPREALECDAVIHSHTNPPLWLQQPYYDGCLKLTSIRNPIGIVNSASFSLNAMASEYVQKFMPRVSETFLRQRLALYKLTDLDFVRGLVKFLKGYLDQYLPVREQYHTMRWEELITNPVGTIQSVGAWLGLDVSAEEAAEIWRPMDHINLLQFHKHNYRQGKGIVGDWKNSLVNEHMDIFREFGYEKYLAELGYPPIPEFDPREYSAYQRLVANYLRRGEIYRCTGDENLFNFAFNKSNIDASSFNFKAYPQREWTRVERSCLANDDVVLAISDVAEQMCADVNALFDEALSLDISTAEEADRVLADLTRRCEALYEERASRLPVRRSPDAVSTPPLSQGGPGEVGLCSATASVATPASEPADEMTGTGTGSPLLECFPELLLVNCDDATAVLAFAGECSVAPLLPHLDRDWKSDVAAVVLPNEFLDHLQATERRESAQEQTLRNRTGDKIAKPPTCLADFAGLPLDTMPATEAPQFSLDPSPRLIEEGRRGFNIVEFQGRYFALAQSLGPMDVAGIDDAWLAGRSPYEAIVGRILAELMQTIDELPERVAADAETPPEAISEPVQPGVAHGGPRWLRAIRPHIRTGLSQLLSRLPGGGK